MIEVLMALVSFFMGIMATTIWAVGFTVKRSLRVGQLQAEVGDSLRARNEARRELCVLIAEERTECNEFMCSGGHVDAMQIAVERGWPELCEDWEE